MYIVCICVYIYSMIFQMVYDKYIQRALSGSRGGTLESVGCDFSDTCTHIHINTYVRVTDTYVYTWQSRAHSSLWAVILQIPICIGVCIYT